MNLNIRRGSTLPESTQEPIRPINDPGQIVQGVRPSTPTLDDERGQLLDRDCLSSGFRQCRTSWTCHNRFVCRTAGQSRKFVDLSYAVSYRRGCACFPRYHRQSKRHEHQQVESYPSGVSPFGSSQSRCKYLSTCYRTSAPAWR